MTTTEAGPTTRWNLSGVGYEYCNCNPGCTCNFSGFPSSSDGSCKALVANVIREGRCGDVDLAGVSAVAIIDWPHAIHDGNGRAVFVVAPETTDDQIGALSQIYTGALGGMPWEILGTTYDVVGLVKSQINITEAGIDSAVEIEGVGRAEGRSMRNPVTDEPHEAHITLPDGFIWTDGNCGVGSFNASAEGVSLDFSDTNWIHYDFSWSN
ncbi:MULTISPECIES: DUF1326 domain-containing protein [unclassified Nocardioides]|uniref:DUF1326 domain-containing protein n=1 Tax=unclassified Nocardioides TaxID=2615069 RepID=UPI0006FA98F9|nr:MULTISPECIES: DUF1326 domain-containing protein [unclassified Nocardioides]KQY56701.1 hypothetical protein ASD30_10325 [Nocardioides sp. Root140]KQZ67100.1 hypothetical protein ASD66_19100 [Nocardioides sp. Root151]KRF12824.1 hypothetical protein ASH02_14975 [Nocardioides sp. Soil796]